MDKVAGSLRILQTLVESVGGSIDPFRHILVQKADTTSESDIAQLSVVQYMAIDGFFHCAAENLTFTDIRRIRQFFGRTLEGAYPGASPTFTQLARTYWTFKVLLNESMPDSSVVVGLLQAIDILFAGVFFPTPGPLGRPKEERERTIRVLIQQSGANLDVEDYIRGNVYLR